MIRAKVRRDGPGEWSWALVDERGDLVIGVVPSWEAAITDVGRELSACARATAADVGHSAIAIGHEIFAAGSITPGDATVPGVDFRCDRRPPWRRWLGL